MADHLMVKQRGYDKNVRTYMELTVSDEHPHGEGPWAGNATEAEIEEWQSHLDSTGELSPDARLTRDETQLAKWIAITEELNVYTSKGEEVPANLQRKAERVWDKKFKEPKAPKKRKRSIQMFLALPEALRDEWGGYEPGILWQTLDNPLTVAELAAMVIEAYPESKYRDNPIGRMKTDIDKFNKAAFNCQCKGDISYKPDNPYPKLGLPERETKTRTKTAEKAATDPVA